MSFAIRQVYIDENRSEVRFREFNDIQGDVQEVMRRGWFNYLESLKARANKEIKRTKRGRRYLIKTKTGGRRWHRASRPFESHANRSGDLRKSLSWKVIGHERASFGYGVSTKAAEAAPVYAGWVERGTIGLKRPGPMAARPSLHDAVDREEVEPHWDRAFDRYF